MREAGFYLFGMACGAVLGFLGAFLWIAYHLPDDAPVKRQTNWDGDYQDVM